jgi:methanogenic corrinoid protein MtbC1
MNTVLCSVPTENPGSGLRRKRSEGSEGVVPKIAITHINNWTKKNGFGSCKFYDMDMLYPSDDDMQKFFEENKADVVGLSAVVSTAYLQVKKISEIIKKVNQNTLIVCGGVFDCRSQYCFEKNQCRCLCSR